MSVSASASTSRASSRRQPRSHSRARAWPSASACGPMRTSSRATRAGGSHAWGRLDEAEAIAERAVAAAPKGMAGVLVFDAAGNLALRRGRVDAAAEHFERAGEQRSRTRDSNWIGNTACGQAEVALWRSDPESARQIAARALEVVAGSEYVQSTVRVYAAALRAVADCALRALRARRRTAVRPRRSATPARRSSGFGPSFAADRRPQGTAGPEPRASRPCASQSSRAPTGNPTPRPGTPRRSTAWPWGCRSNWRTPAGDRPRRSSSAVATAPPRRPRCARPPQSPRPCGRRCWLPRSPGLARRARIALSHDDAVARETPELDRFGLTEREHSVLALVAEGHTNREIGETLFISEKTASVHVSRILAKLGVPRASRPPPRRTAWDSCKPPPRAGAGRT